MAYKEIEVRFLEIDKEQLLSTLRAIPTVVDHGEHVLDERIIYDDALTWRDGARKILRLRSRGERYTLAYKDRVAMAVDGVEEIEFGVTDIDAAEALLHKLGFTTYRHQQKKRHSFSLGDVIVDIDTWPHVPTYVELEGPSEARLREVAEQLGLAWDTHELRSPRTIIEDTYHIPVGNMRWFTFDRCE